MSETQTSPRVGPEPSLIWYAVCITLRRADVDIQPKTGLPLEMPSGLTRPLVVRPSTVTVAAIAVAGANANVLPRSTVTLAKIAISSLRWGFGRGVGGVMNTMSFRRFAARRS